MDSASGKEKTPHQPDQQDARPCWHQYLIMEPLKIAMNGTIVHVGEAPLCMRRFAWNRLAMCAACRAEALYPLAKLAKLFGENPYISDPVKFVHDRLDAGQRDYLLDTMKGK